MKSNQLLLLGIAVFVSSCCSIGGQKTEWRHEKKAISLQMVGDERLNLYQEKPHSLILCVYHLKDLNAFNQMLDQKGGLPLLLDCGRFDPSVTYAKRFVLQPKQKLEEAMDRTEGAKYVGVVAGYYDLRKENSSRSIQIPLSIMNNPKKVDIRLNLGPNALEEIKE